MRADGDLPGDPGCHQATQATQALPMYPFLPFCVGPKPTLSHKSSRRSSLEGVMVPICSPFQPLCRPLARPARLFDKIQHAWRAVKFPPTMPASARALIKLLLAKQPEHRPTAEELLAHPWVTGRACASDPAPSASCTPCGDDQLVPDVASPNLGRKRGSPVDLEPLVIPKATEPRCSPSASPLVSPMSTGAMLHKMWQPASISVGADAPQGVSAKRRRGSVGDIEQAFALKAAQIPKMNEWATVSSQPPSPIAPLDGLAPSLVVS